MLIKRFSSISATERAICCDVCDHAMLLPSLQKNQKANCPHCHHTVRVGNLWSLKRCSILALSILILMPFAFSFPLLNIQLLGTPIYASIWSGVWKMATEGYPYTAFLVLFCAIVMPIAFVVIIILLQICYLFKINAKMLLLSLNYIKSWVMLDVYLVSLGVAAFKVREYASISFTLYLLPFVLVTFLTILLFTKTSPKQFWDKFYPYPTSPDAHLRYCKTCGLSFPAEQAIGHFCPRCHADTSVDTNLILQRTWSTLIAGAIMLIPANLLPISVVYVNGAPSADTLMSGVIAFMQMGNYSIAAIVFIASIFVPVSKILIMLYLLGCVHFGYGKNIHLQMKLFEIVHFVGRWSMLDLFVLSLMMSLVTRGQIISFSVGPAAIYFGLAVFLTMISAEVFDTRLLWKNYETHK
ncbi:paraquat-inducible protein A [Gallibacterium salpingitidis]|uniref:Membrane protein n=1 Tax=Gallibacterium salpingitidis TaxID=505341 RepID=A0A1A7P1B8_9PAST|nr:paraquat-inducible protein A [Gallibacterium salpingitidis]OBW95625.1 membrane protein [Gallibacterium salpingitidis]